MELSNLRILITRPRPQAEKFARLLEAAGAIPVLLPAIQIGPLADPRTLDRALGELSGYDWLVLTSANGVEAVWGRFSALDILGERKPGMRQASSPIPPCVRVAAIGPKTAAALEKHGVRPDFVPEEYVAEAILPGLGDLRGRRVLLLRADLARPALAEAIRSAGGIAKEVSAYRTLPAESEAAGLAALRQGIDVLTFTSSSTVNNFTTLARQAGLDPAKLPGEPLIACIGPITAATARQVGYRVDVAAETYTVEGLVEALLKYETGEKKHDNETG
jgi:uroporphyrinogen-III synthase